jgi:uncharacterized membrane protein YoaK (UPF0700 family)
VSSERTRDGEQAQAVSPLLLAALASVGGYVDAVTYLGFGRVFTANMTGNTVLLAIATGHGDGAGAARSLCALGGFCAGAVLAALLLREPAHGAWPRRAPVALGLEATCVAALVVLAAVAGTSGAAVYPLIVLSGLAMGGQSSLVWLARSSGVATTYITGTLTGMLVRAARGRRAGGRSSRLAVPAVVWVDYLLAAGLGVAASRPFSVYAMAGPAAMLFVLAAILSRRRTD